MSVRGLISIIIILMLLLGLWTSMVFKEARSDSLSPEISNIHHTPKYPTYPETVDINATIYDLDGIQEAKVFFCYTPPGFCSLKQMEDPDGDGVYGANILTAENGTLADYNVTAKDWYGNEAFSETVWFYFVSWVRVENNFSNLKARPNQPIWVNGSAFYDGNISTPAENSSIKISIVETGDSWSGTTDEIGNYNVEITAPSQQGSYVINVTVSNRTLRGHSEATLIVAEVPLPDLSLSKGDITFSTSNPLEGQKLHMVLTIYNLGNENATEALLRISLDEPSNVIFSRNFSIEKGGQRTLSADWDCIAGNHSILFYLDPDNELAELLETNNNVSITIFVDGDFDKDGLGNLTDEDDDNDGLPDAWENSFGLNPLDSNDSALDSDNDGLSNLEEFGIGTNPLSFDTDGDGFGDGEEVRAGTDPLDPLSKPPTFPWVIFIIGLAAVVSLLVTIFIIARKKARS